MSLIEKFEEFVGHTFPTNAHALTYQQFDSFHFDSEDPNLNRICLQHSDSGLSIGFKKDNLFFHDLKQLKKWIRKACFNFETIMPQNQLHMIVAFWASQLQQNTSYDTKLHNAIATLTQDTLSHPQMIEPT